LSALALAGPCLVGRPDRGPDSADRSLLGNHPHWVQAVAFTADGRRLASAGYDGSVHLWDVPGAALDRILQRDGGGKLALLHGLAFTPDGSTLAAGDADGSVLLWDLASEPHRRTLPGRANGATSLAFSPDGRILATGMETGAS
jgi:WD40 repeat protein